MAHEANCPLPEDIDLIGRRTVVLCMLAHCEAECLTDHIVEGHCEEVPAEQEQTEAVHAVKFAPLRLFFEDLVDLYCLATFSHLDRKRFFLSLEL